MTAAEIVVTVLGSCAIVWINYWFFTRPRTSTVYSKHPGDNK